MMDSMTAARDARGKIKRRERLATARLLGTHTKEDWDRLKSEFDYRCVKCGMDRMGLSLDKDHIVPLYQGGSDGIENIQPPCAWCNAKKGPDSFNWIAFRRLNPFLS